MNETIHDAVKRYTQNGAVVHPLSNPKDQGKSPGKRPLIKGWQKLKKTPEKIGDDIRNGCNIGLVCGKASDCTIIDFDLMLFFDEISNGFDLNTLQSNRTNGRGHVYFRYNPDLPAQKHHLLGIEILSDGSNAVLPPSVHVSGDVYKWKNPDAPIMKMPAKLVENLNNLFNKEKRLNSIINKCRPCFKQYWKDEKKVKHGSTARLFLGAFCSELFNKNADLDIIKLFAKIIYQEGYDEQRTIIEFNGWTEKKYKPWTCEKIKEQCVGFTDCNNCKVKKSGRKTNGNGASFSQATALIGYIGTDDIELFHDDRQDPYARIKLNGKNAIMPVQGRQFRRWITGQFFDDTGTAPGGEAITQALGVIEAKACRNGKEYKLHNRIAEYEGAFWYDLGSGISVKIDGTGWEIIRNPPILFKSYKHQKTHPTNQIALFQDCSKCQKDQCKGGHVKRVLDFVNLNDEKDRLLFVVYLISCFIPNIPHPIPVLHGDKGSSKSTVFKFLKELIDPSVLRILTFPKDNTEMVQKLDHHHFAPFDNVTTLSEWQSDALCRACTGEGFSKREFYTNDEDVLFDYQRCIGLNGVNIVATKADLLDRALLLKLDRIPKDKRKPEAMLWKMFDETKSEILAGIFTVLSKAILIKPDINLNELPRMADFMIWGCAISEALGDGQKAFYDAYTANIQSQNKEAIEASPVGELIMRFMDNKTTWGGRAAELLKELEILAELHRINIRSKSFPKAANTLTRRINEIKTNLSEEGLKFEVKKDEKCNILLLTKVSAANVVEESKKETLSEEIASMQVSASLITEAEKPALKVELMKKASAALEVDKAFMAKVIAKISTVKETKSAASASKLKTATLPGNNASQANLSEEGLKFDIKKDEKCNIILPFKVSGNTSSTSIHPVSITREGEKAGDTKKLYLQLPPAVPPVPIKAGDTCKTTGGIPPVIQPVTNQEALTMAGDTGDTGGISLNIYKGANHTEMVEKSAKKWEQIKEASINSSTLTEAVFWVCKETDLEPLEVRLILERLFKITPGTSDETTIEVNGEVSEVVIE